MHARVVTFQRRPDQLDQAERRFREQVLPVLRQQAGFQRAYVLVDRASGKQLAISVWETEEAMNRAGAALDPLRERASRELGDPAPSTSEGFELVAQV